MKNKNQENWEKEFDKGFAIGIGRNWFFTEDEAKEIKSFIRQLLKEEKEKLIKDFRAELKVSIFQARQELLERIKLEPIKRNVPSEGIMKKTCEHKAIAKGNGEKEWRCVFCGKIKNPSRSPKKEL